jgi:hypothetical protein
VAYFIVLQSRFQQTPTDILSNNKLPCLTLPFIKQSTNPSNSTLLVTTYSAHNKFTGPCVTVVSLVMCCYKLLKDHNEETGIQNQKHNELERECDLVWWSTNITLFLMRNWGNHKNSDFDSDYNSGVPAYELGVLTNFSRITTECIDISIHTVPVGKFSRLCDCCCNLDTSPSFHSWTITGESLRGRTKTFKWLRVHLQHAINICTMIMTTTFSIYWRIKRTLKHI